MNKEFEELKKAAQPLIDYLKKYNLNTIAVVDKNRIDIYSAEIGMSFDIE